MSKPNHHIVSSSSRVRSLSGISQLAIASTSTPHSSAISYTSPVEQHHQQQLLLQKRQHQQQQYQQLQLLSRQNLESKPNEIAQKYPPNPLTSFNENINIPMNSSNQQGITKGNIANKTDYKIIINHTSTSNKNNNACENNLSMQNNSNNNINNSLLPNPRSEITAFPESLLSTAQKPMHQFIPKYNPLDKSSSSNSSINHNINFPVPQKDSNEFSSALFCRQFVQYLHKPDCSQWLSITSMFEDLNNDLNSVNSENIMNTNKSQQDKKLSKSFRQNNTEHPSNNKTTNNLGGAATESNEKQKPAIEVSNHTEGVSSWTKIYTKATQIQSAIFKPLREFIPRKFDILLSCLKQQFDALSDLYAETLPDTPLHDSYPLFSIAISAIQDQFYKIFSRHIAQIQHQFQSSAAGTVASPASNLTQSQLQHSQMQKTTQQQQQQYLQASQLSSSTVAAASTTTGKKLSFHQGATVGTASTGTGVIIPHHHVTNVEEFKEQKQHEILLKYSNEQTFSLKVQQLEKQLKSLSISLEMKSKESDQHKHEKHAKARQIEFLEKKIIDLERKAIISDSLSSTSNGNGAAAAAAACITGNLSSSDPTMLLLKGKSGEIEYLTKRHECEKNELRRVIEMKNDEIRNYRIELESILREVDLTSRHNLSIAPTGSAANVASAQTASFVPLHNIPSTIEEENTQPSLTLSLPK